MRSFSTVLLALFVFSAPLHAQGKDEFDRVFKQGFDALTAGNYDAGIKAFERCLKITPEHPTCAYNLACGYSLKKELETALGWFEKAGKWGFCKSRSSIDLLEKDADLNNIREDARFKSTVALMEKALKDAAAYSKVPASYIPEALQNSPKPLPLLVVLHDDGGTKDTIVTGPWKGIADSLGCALLAPSGKSLFKLDPKEGMAWFDSFQEYARKYWSSERTIHDAVEAFQKVHKLDESRIYLAGEGNGGMVAFNVAVRGKGLYKRVVVVNGLMHLRLAADRAGKAGQRGLQAAMLIDKSSKVPGIARTKLGPLLSSTEQSLKKWGIKGPGVVRFDSKEAGKPSRTDRILEALRGAPKNTSPTGSTSKPTKADG